MARKKKLSVVLLSGGLDSCVTAAIAAKNADIALLHANYGQRTERRELKSFRDIAKYFKAGKTLLADMRYIRDIGASALIDTEIKVPKGKIKRRGIPVTYVPFRNAQLLSVAIAWAEAIGANEVYIGAVEEDYSGYPDCRTTFFRAFEKTARLGTRPETKIKIKTPLIKMTKGQIVKTGARLNAPLKLTWSCYKDSRKACGECDSCALRLKGFDEAGIKDPVPYKTRKKRNR